MFFVIEPVSDTHGPRFQAERLESKGAIQSLRTGVFGIDAKVDLQDAQFAGMQRPGGRGQPGVCPSSAGGTAESAATYTHA